jgi:hypothetical protein
VVAWDLTDSRQQVWSLADVVKTNLSGRGMSIFGKDI